MAKQADCNSVALGRCRFKSYSADYTPQSLKSVEELSAKQLVGDTGLRVRPPPVALYGDVC